MLFPSLQNHSCLYLKGLYIIYLEVWFEKYSWYSVSTNELFGPNWYRYIALILSMRGSLLVFFPMLFTPFAMNECFPEIVEEE